MPRADAFLVDATLDAIAASARAAGDERTTGQLRADALVALSLHALRAGQHRAAGRVPPGRLPPMTTPQPRALLTLLRRI